jgi:hypothetical protein
MSCPAASGGTLNVMTPLSVHSPIKSAPILTLRNNLHLQWVPVAAGIARPPVETIQQGFKRGNIVHRATAMRAGSARCNHRLPDHESSSARRKARSGGYRAFSKLAGFCSGPLRGTLGGQTHPRIRITHEQGKSPAGGLGYRVSSVHGETRFGAFLTVSGQ